MSTQSHTTSKLLRWLPALVVCLPVFGHAQVPVDGDGAPLADYDTGSEFVATGNEEIPLLSATELQDLVGPIALYPDDLLAIVLPASAYPLQIVQAGRFLDDLENDPSLKPDESWDDSVVALTNYPEVVRLLNDDLDWTWQLGEAVVAQQTDVIAAVESFRDRAYAAGNLKSDAHQTVSQDDGYIEITPVADDVIYVPYYEPERVVVYQPRPVYYYYPRPYPVYYYPYSAGYAFNRGYFWGVTTAFTIGWHSNHLNVFHHSYHGHPYFGHSYWDSWWYRRPTINVYNNIYAGHRGYRSSNHYRHGDRWRPQTLRRTVHRDNERITRTRHYPGNSARNNDDSRASLSRSGNRSQSSRADRARRESSRNEARSEIRFRSRPSTGDRSSSNRDSRSDRVVSDRNSRQTTPDVRRDRSASRDNSARRDTPARLDTSQRSRPSSSSVRRSLVNEQRQSESRRSQARRSEPRQPRAAQSQTRRSEPRQPQAAQSQTRRSEPRQTRAAQSQTRRSEPRQSQARQSQSRRSEPRQSQSRPSRSRESAARKSESKSNKVASISRKEKSSRSDRRH